MFLEKGSSFKRSACVSVLLSAAMTTDCKTVQVRCRKGPLLQTQ
jgi:hypothetical protein